MKPLDIDKLRSVMGMARAFTLDGEALIDRRTLCGKNRPPGQWIGLQNWKDKRKAAKKQRRRVAFDKAIIERRERRWASGLRGTSRRSFRSATQLVAHREAIKQLFEVKPVLRTVDLLPITGKRWWRQDINWMIKQGLCMVDHEQTDGSQPHGRLHGRKRIFTRTEKPWVEWKPYHMHAKAYEVSERAANAYLD